MASLCSTRVARRSSGLSILLEQPAVEEADDPLFVCRRLGLDTAHVLGARNLPDLLRPALDLVELVVGRLLGRLALFPVDEEHRVVDLRDEASQVGRGVSLVESAVPAVTIAAARVSSHLPPGFASSSRTERPLPPSETIAFSALDSAAASIIISPPTDRPMPPIRPGSTSGRLCTNLTAAWMSRSPCQPSRFGSPSLSPSPSPRRS